MGYMCPVELEVKDMAEGNSSASYMTFLSIHSTLLCMTNVPISVSILQTFRPFESIFNLCPSMILFHIINVRACCSYECLILWASRLSNKLLTQGYIIERLKYKRRLLLRCIHHFKWDIINNMDHMHICT